MTMTFAMKRLTLRKVFGFTPDLLIKALSELPPSARVYSLCNVTSGDRMWIDINYYTEQPAAQTKD